MTKKEFTFEDAIAIQTEQLNGWKKVLLPEVFETLHYQATLDNNDRLMPESITRGSDLSVIVSNIIGGNIPLLKDEDFRVVELTVTRYYSKQVTFSVKIPRSIDEDDIQDYLTEDEDIDALAMEKLNNSTDLNEDDTEWDYLIPSLQTGGTL
jgi:hypothetical protein